MDAILIDVFASYLYALKYGVMAVAVLLLVSGIDDLFIDIAYWVRRLWRAVAVYSRHRHMDHHALRDAAEKPLAIMVPAWQEHGVIGRMAELAATTLDYENYHIFVGTYPNDPDTQRDVDEVCARFPNVHKVVCVRPGPTSKADCLNNVVDAIFRFERRASLSFAGFVLHDSEDVLCGQELRLFNHLVARKDLIQVPVYPLERQWHNFTSMHYLDEFAEMHGKDLLVREALAGQVPSAGVGTCFSRRALLALLADGDGIAFDVQSLTEDYDIGFRLKARGMHEIFVRFPAPDDGPRRYSLRGLFKSRRESSVVCVREYFPDRAATAIRQKARWIVGIVFQGYRSHGWTRSGVLNYFLWRDRKGAINNFISFAAVLILLQLSVLWLLQLAWPDAPRFLSIFEGHGWLRMLLLANLALMLNRMLQRVVFVTPYYGLWQGLLALPRLFWGSYINFMATCRAIHQVVVSGDPRRVAWDKTMHDFPSLGEARIARRPLGRILVEHGALDAERLEAALVERIAGLRLGSSLVHQGLVTTEQLARAVAEQAGATWERIEPYRPSQALHEVLPAEAVLRYGIVPLREEQAALVVASESAIDPVALAALSRRLRRPVRYVIARKGEVAVAIRRYWTPGQDDPAELLDAAVRSEAIDPARAACIWEAFVSRQVTLGEVLMALGRIDAVAFRALMLRYGPGRKLGEYLVEQGVLDRAALQQALMLQAELQPSMPALLAAEPGRETPANTAGEAVA